VRALPHIVVALVATATLGTCAAGVAGASGVALSTQLLSVSQLPSGWSVASDTGNTGAGCLANLLEPSGIAQTQVSEVYFVHSGNLPFLDEKVATYSSVKKAFTKIASTIAGCHHPSGPYKGYQFTGTVTKWSYPTQGSASIAYHMVFTTTTHLTVYYDYVIARKKNAIVAVLEGGYPDVSSSQFSGLVHKALAKVTS
jgi:hypothetical protein